MRPVLGRFRAVWLVGSVLIGGASLAAGQEPHGFGPGTYLALPRDSGAVNRFAGIQFHFLRSGGLVWQSGGQVQVMSWEQKGDTVSIADPAGCALDPVGWYRVITWREGYRFEPIRDGCGPRVATAARFYLVPETR